VYVFFVLKLSLSSVLNTVNSKWCAFLLSSPFRQEYRIGTVRV